VRFRWLDAAGRTIARDKARSRSCRQPDGRPELEVAELAIGDTYRVLVRNRGRSAAPAFDLELSIDGVPVAAVRVAELGARRERLVEIDGPACGRGDEVTVTADPADAVPERSERNNALALTCP
jgi:subtilase family serine protease